MGRAAAIFPGQGAQSVGMAAEIVAQSKRAREIFDRAGQVLRLDLARLCREGPAEELERTDIQQPAIFTASVAIWEAFIEQGGRLTQFCWAGGLSLGEYTALCVAGAVDFNACLRLVRRRGELMQKAAQQTAGGMVTLVGGDEAAVEKLCERARGDDVLVAANYNCPGQVVISGSKNACQRATTMAEEFGLRAVPLAVAGAFHSPLMEPAATGLRKTLQETDFTTPTLPVISNVDARNHGEAADIRATLERQLTHPVRWQRCMEKMIEAGVDQFVEFGPGRVLTGLMRKIDRNVNTLNVNDHNGIQRALFA